MNGSDAGPADQPGGQTTDTVPASLASLLSLANVRRSENVESAAAVTWCGYRCATAGKPAQRRRSTVVQPIARVQRLRDLGIRCQQSVFGVQQPGHVESRQRGADLVPVQVGEVMAALWPSPTGRRPADRDTVPSGERDGDIGVTAAGFDQPDRDVAGVDALGAATGQRVAGRLEGPELHRAGRLDLQQRAGSGQLAESGPDDVTAQQRMGELGAALRNRRRGASRRRRMTSA